MTAIQPRPAAGPQVLTEEDKRNLLGGDARTAWASPQGDALVRAMASGAFEQAS